MSKHSETTFNANASAETASANIDRLVRWADDFPVQGVRFADLTPVFADADGLSTVIEALAVAGAGADLVAGIDARGFLLGAGVALALGSGVLAVRKAGKLPPPVVAQRYELEYGSAQLEIPESIDLIGRRILVVDDVLATGGTIAATATLLRARGAQVVGAAVVLEISELDGRSRCDGYPLTSLKTV
ncbi:adenine phosphoribosyltransferase [Rhodococcus sp. H36-A4]|uniref:adenine phosphoribosyltransferase n=1 Tax=Rhodococcus sp. H36-A4 TaxID=3004353 RepID=UPI0022AE637E|nr:adenine phosphoribosyltransferase [Rhodococcus sp. H36-A4]MCZ4079671.1 adenine phosphoribosyltransferase [Rhodococcus sp. H36-A4]